jgi:hypothetical protein
MRDPVALYPIDYSNVHLWRKAFEDKALDLFFVDHM